MDPVHGYQAVNVEAQQRYETSLLNWVRHMISIRKGQKAFGRGSMQFIKPKNRKIFAFSRSYQDETIVCIYNLSRAAQPVEMDLHQYRGALPIEMIGETRFPVIGTRPYQLALGPYGFYWFLLGKGDATDE